MLPRLFSTLAAIVGSSRLAGGGATNGKRKVLLTRRASQALTPHASVHVLRWNGEEILLGCTAQQIRVLARKSVDPDGEGP